MFQYIPAQLGWYVLSIVDGVEFRRDPIIAWKIESDEAGPVPITSRRSQIALDETHVIVTPDGKVVDNDESRGKGDTIEGYIQRVQQGDDKRDEQERDRKAKQPVAAMASPALPNAPRRSGEGKEPFKVFSKA
jgi:hypothetical protein